MPKPAWMWGARRLLDEYSLGATLGAGAFGVVRRATRLADGATAAVKSLERRRVDPQALAREVDILRRVAGNEHIVRLLDVYDMEDRLYHIALELVDGGELTHCAARGLGPTRRPFTMRDALVVARQLGAALEHLDALSVVHRDIKPQNVMLRGGGGAPRWVLIDFGAACVCERPGAARGQAGSGGYMAPEMLAGASYGAAVDLYSVGAVLHVVLLGCKPPTPGNRTWRNSHVDPAFAALIESLLVSAPRHRLDARGLVAACDSLLARTDREARRTVGRWVPRHGADARAAAPIALPHVTVELLERVARAERGERSCAKRVAAALGADDLARWRELHRLFKAIDVNGDGCITPRELASALVDVFAPGPQPERGPGREHEPARDHPREERAALAQSMLRELCRFGGLEGGERMAFDELFVAALAQCLAGAPRAGEDSAEAVHDALVAAGLEPRIAARVAAKVAPHGAARAEQGTRAAMRGVTAAVRPPPQQQRQQQRVRREMTGRRQRRQPRTGAAGRQLYCQSMAPVPRAAVPGGARGCGSFSPKRRSGPLHSWCGACGKHRHKHSGEEEE